MPRERGMTMKHGIIGTTAACVGAAAGLTVLLIAPGHATTEMKAPFMHRNFAHRGLHKRDKSVPENSLAAFRRAVKAGYGVELDVHITKDDQLAVFHDDNLKRVTGVDRNIEDLTMAELKQLRLCGTEETIPTLQEVLEVLDGKVPLILEIKRGKRNTQLCQLIRSALFGYNGPVCIESFDPTIIRWWMKHAPEVLRGQLSQPPKDYKGEAQPAVAFLCGNLLTNVLCRPHFIAYRIAPKPFTVRLCDAMGAIRAGWTSKEWSHEQDYDILIFERYKPGVWFRAQI